MDGTTDPDGTVVSSSYLDHLPAAFRETPFVGEFLLAFEAILHGHDDVAGLQEIIGPERSSARSVLRVADHLDPATAPTEFLPWLAGWVGLTLRADWDADTTRGFLAEIVPLYRRRGTLGGLKRMLEIYLRPLGDTVTRDDVVIIDDFAEPAHYFQVRLTLADADPARLRATQEVARAIIDQEKPAHTFYALRVVIPTMRLVSTELRDAEDPPPELLILGRNTWLGSR
ncbi:phage tail protein [Pseudonocardia sp.]|uniref:phage tail protein n=1 Tax=Pseudonocardia sp. TaxID=60912 RepID=UPI003D0B30F4